MTQVKNLFDIPGTGGFRAVGKETHDMPLGGGQIHLRQLAGNGLIHGAVEPLQPGAVVLIQREHLSFLKR